MSDDRRYSDREVRKLLARAVELSRESGGESEGAREGVTLAELEKTAQEAGLPLDALHSAIDEADRGGVARPGFWNRAFGTMVISGETRLGRSLTEAELANLALVLPDLSGVSGSSAQAGGGLLFRSDGGYEARTGARFRFEVSRDGKASVERDITASAGGVYGGVVGGMGLGAGLGVGLGVGLGTLHSPLFAILFGLGSLALSFLGSRGIMAAIASDAKRRNARLLEDVKNRLG